MIKLFIILCFVLSPSRSDEEKQEWMDVSMLNHSYVVI